MNPESFFVRFLRIYAEEIEQALGVAICGAALALLFFWGIK